MNEQQKLFFQVNAGIKNIVGKELIHSDSIAIIELIKNSKDADATKSTIQFINEQKSQDSSLIISDNGKGMSLNDLKNKWLNVAYSEKKENMLNKLYAGNKGVGRFSCDRLGKNLTLYTKAQEGNYIKLSINWEDFENKGINDEMSTIPVLAQELSKHDFLQEINVQNFTTGTILKIENLRETWPTTKLRKLIAELEKFSPSIDDDFSIFLYSDNQDTWNNIYYDDLYMRKDGDQRKDNVIKQEILKHIKEKYEISFAFDDRKSVVDMWRENGVFCFQCQDHNY